MNINNYFSVSTLIICLLSISSCIIKGKEVCGIWISDNNLGSMTIEITPWDGKFYGYMLEYSDEGEKVIGGKEEEFIILTDLTFQKEGSYSSGKIYIDVNSKTKCDISLTMNNQNELIATYTCDGHNYEEKWSRKGFLLTETVGEDQATYQVKGSKEKEENSKENNVTISKNPIGIEKNVEKNNESIASSSSQTVEQDESQRREAFSIIGVQKVVSYEDNEAIEQEVTNLWNSIYTDDFSSKIKIKQVDKLYMVYSHYDQPKGKMTITLGYEVTESNHIPEGLRAIQISTNDYYVAPLSGERSDYKGEEWDQIEELMYSRNAESVDFEVYTFNENYEVSDAKFWIATK